MIKVLSLGNSVDEDNTKLISQIKNRFFKLFMCYSSDKVICLHGLLETLERSQVKYNALIFHLKKRNHEIKSRKARSSPQSFNNAAITFIPC